MKEGACAGEGNGFVDGTFVDPVLGVGGRTGDGLGTITYRFD